MNGAPEAAKSVIQHPQERMSSRERYYLRLKRAIDAVDSRLVRLACLGRPGQWILHHEDIYSATLDTRPHSRNPDEEVPVRGLTYPEKGIVWAGKGTAPNFKDIRFWEGKRKDLDEKIEQVKAKLVQPRFTPEELQSLESLEEQAGHFFHTELDDKRKRMVGDKTAVFNILFDLAGLGRPGQWILHNEELYHPAIDTRPQTRAAEKSIVIRDATYKGDTRVLGDGVLVDYELTWAGNGPQPDFADFDYWENKRSDLRDKRRQVKEGLVQPRFTPDELRTLESMEGDEDHAFTIYARERRENPSVVKTAESFAALQKLAETQQMVISLMDDLWDCGLAGKWVLHYEDLYLPVYDTRFRERDKDEDRDTLPGHIVINNVIDDFNDLRFDSRFRSPPDFGNIAYWEEKRAELRKKRDDVEAGKLVTHHFSEGELMRIELLERAILEQRERERDRLFSSTDQKTKGVAAWLNGDTEGAMPTPPQPRTPTPPPRTHLLSGVPNHAGRRGHVTENVGAEHSQLRNSEALKRKRSTNNEDESLPGHAMRPVKRNKKQSQPELTSTMPTMPTMPTRRPSPPQKVRGHVRTATSISPLDPSNARGETDSRVLAGRGTQRSTGFTQGGSGVVGRRA
ncbi:hypothetical protein SPBR_00396 [Sporothrix brasiliensis 5110]|uniref:Uncharacterized protein n=1 Tax=Sporothrix brasiliensis 5110 TaxID=1398154 RepID=A0A0C2IV92_9PEZI|nr:uncharacterized protein SPBR_00396 [Sporothrix brasiliensis 5110]KIH90685.1 hypothetical protein SPBR_00396 [Sporothrix brasiliensis 5110]